MEPDEKIVFEAAIKIAQHHVKELQTKPSRGPGEKISPYMDDFEEEDEEREKDIKIVKQYLEKVHKDGIQKF